ncbi:putative membrane protein [Mariprofundus aestuarium]|uniref:Putative membrane protein n=1 Tax=Mariprofundus aestuarium TaxID=1921086 RepID=A0A2K8KYR0_MARES|nr:DUF2079 domain-containing protein [Mariprofundus aestuarium]ATX79912.1 putative membrane protein [Mariprofundus aestuarium]
MITGKRSVWWAGLWAAILVHFTFFLIIGMSHHWGYLSSINDLGTFDQLVWSTLHGNFLQTTINPFETPMIRLGIHFDPILLLFVPLYALSASIEWLIIAQAAALALAAWPVFLLARHTFQSEKSGFIWTIVYLMNPFLLSAGSWDFHPVTLTVPFIALGLLAVVKQNIRMLILSCLFILMCKEHMGLTVIGFGLLWWFHNRDWKTAFLVAALGATHLLLVLYFIMPLLSPIGTPVMLGEQLGQMSRYNWLGNSLTEVIHTMMTQPDVVWARVVKMGGIIYWWLLSIPFFFVFPFIGLQFLLPGLGDLVANTLSSNPMPKGIWSYHSAGLIPVITAAAMHGVERITRWQTTFSAQGLAGLIVASSLVTGYFFLPLPLTGAINYWAPNHVLSWPNPNVQMVRSALGSSTSLSIQANIGAHFTQRQSIYLYPAKVGEVDAIVLHLASPTTNINFPPEQRPDTLKNHHITWLDGHLQMDRTEYLASIESLLDNKEYGILLWNDPWLVLSKTATSHQPEGVKSKIRQLREEWDIEPTEYRNTLDKHWQDDYSISKKKMR